MFQLFNSLWKRIVVDEVPAEMDKCFDCGKLECSEIDYQTCAARIQRQADIENARGARKKCAGQEKLR